MEPASSIFCSWPSPSQWPDLRESAVHVWCVSLDAPEAESDPLSAILSAEELRQAGRMRLEHVRRRFVARRAALRRILGRYLNAGPETIRFDRGAYGKPSLGPPWNDSRIRFSTTHSAGLALVAFALGADLGVDVEQIRPLDSYEDLCRRYFAPPEQESLRRLPEPERLAAFFRGWARKEALMKAIGTGLSLGLDQVVVSLEAGPAPRVYSIQGSTAAAGRWRLDDLQPATGYVAALARPTGPCRVECFRWP
jgi:4'-phosphopantetheinyl transferase